MTKRSLILLLCALLFSTTLWAQVPGSGTEIINQASASYTDPSGATINTVSEPVKVIVAAIAGVQVTPDETTPPINFGPLENQYRTFAICNSGNVANTVHVTDAKIGAPATLQNLYYDLNANGVVDAGDVPVVIGTTETPTLQPGQCVPVIVSFNTGNAQAGTTTAINLTATTVTPGVNGNTTDAGQRLYGMNEGPKFSDPRDPQKPPVKTSSETSLSDPLSGKTQMTVATGQEFWYYITFKNSGGSEALNVTFVDDLPNGVTYVANTLKVDGVALTDAVDADNGDANGARVQAKWASIAIGATVKIEFKAKLGEGIPAGTGLINRGIFSGTNFPQTTTNPNTVIQNPVGIVFAGRAGGSVPISGAVVTLATDPAGSNPLNIPSNSGYAPNQANTPTLTTSASGAFNFVPAPSQLGAVGVPAVYYITSQANGYASRTIQVTIVPTGDGLFTATLHSSDGQSLAVSGGFTITSGDVLLPSLSVLTFNLPMFETQTLEIRKTVDKAFAVVGDIVSYNVAVTNRTNAPVSDAVVVDKLPGGFRLAENKVQLLRGQTVTNVNFTSVGGVSTIPVGMLAAHETVTLQYRVIVGPSAHQGQSENLATAEGKFPTGEVAKSPTARASVLVQGGIFSDKQAIIGRVFEDLNKNGFYDKEADRPVAGARIYTANGTAVVTDANGQYNLPMLDAGSIVLILDPLSVPQGAMLIDENLKYQHSWTRLVQRPLLGGGIMRQNFALAPSGWQPKEIETAHIARRPCEDEKEFDCRMKKLRERAAHKIHDEADKASGRELDTVVQPQFAESAAQVERINENQIVLPRYKSGEVLMDRALSLEARVAQGHSVKLEVNGKEVGDNQIGRKLTDPKVGFSSYYFNGVNLNPGPNSVKVVSVGPDGAEKAVEMLSLYGRGPSEKLSLHPSATVLRAGGRQTIDVVIEAFDQWGNPAADNDILVLKASAGSLQRLGAAPSRHRQLMAQDLTRSNGLSVEQTPETENQVKLEMLGGLALVQYIAPQQTGLVKFFASNGTLHAESQIQIDPEIRPTLMVGVGKVSVGTAAPEHQISGDNEKVTGRGQFFLKAPLGNQTTFTGSYDTSRPLNRLLNQNQLFQQNPQDRMYPIFGDSSTRFQEVQSNSKLYFKLEHGQQYAMFGDFRLLGNEVGNYQPSSFQGVGLGSNVRIGTTANTLSNFAGFGASNSAGPRLSLYERSLTGGKLHIKANKQTYLTMAAARPQTQFARDVFPGNILGYAKLSASGLLPNTEQVFLEYRDRRSPEVVQKTEALVRGIDYQIDYLTGVLYLQRSLQAFTSALDLVQVVTIYEFADGGNSSNVYAGRAQWGWKGLNVGGTYIDQLQNGFGAYQISGVDLHKSLFNGGNISAEWSRTSGQVAAAGNYFGLANGFHRGNAYRAEWHQPLGKTFVANTLYTRSDEGYFNPFGGTITPGTKRFQAALTANITANDEFTIGYIGEQNKTVNVDNGRKTVDAEWSHQFGKKFRANLGYAMRELTTNSVNSTTTTNSQMVKAGVEYNPTEKLSLQVSREQNLVQGKDQTYPDQWLLGAKYKLNNFTNLFFTQRLGSAAILPIADLSSTGFAASNSRKEMSFGFETKFFRNTNFVSRYQIEQGINGTDSFAVLGVNQKFQASKTLSLDAGVEKGFHTAGQQDGFVSGSLAAAWMPTEDFKTSLRYELRDRMGLGQILSAGAAGRMTENLTSLGNFQLSKTNFQNIESQIMQGRAAFAYRPAESDRVAWLLSYDMTSFDRGRLPGDAGRGLNFSLTQETVHQVTTDGLYKPFHNGKVELFGRAAFRQVSSEGPSLNRLSTDTYLFQGRIQDRFSHYFDAAVEGRWLGQVGWNQRRTTLGAELGFWPLEDVRLGFGYNRSALDARFAYTGPIRSGFYFTITTKLANIFNLFGTSHQGIETK